MPLYQLFEIETAYELAQSYGRNTKDKVREYKLKKLALIKKANELRLGFYITEQEADE